MYFDLDLDQMSQMPASNLDGMCRRVLKCDVVVLDEYAVKESDAMIHASATGDRIFVEHAQTAADNNPTILPGSFNAANFDSHVGLFATLTDINTSIAQLTSSVDDTRMAVGSEAMNEARQVYEYVKSAAKNTPGLKPVADQLGERFQHTSAAKPAATPAK